MSEREESGMTRRQDARKLATLERRVAKANAEASEFAFAALVRELERSGIEVLRTMFEDGYEFVYGATVKGTDYDMEELEELLDGESLEHLREVVESLHVPGEMSEGSVAEIFCDLQPVSA